MLVFSPHKSFSHALIVLSVVISCIGLVFPAFYVSYSLHSWQFLQNFDNFINLGLQILLFQFLHANLFHLGLNMYFLYLAGLEVEARMKGEYFIGLFVFTTLVCAIAIIFFSSGMTVGISGFCMALLAYIWIDLQSLGHHRANEFGFLLLINIATGIFFSGISFVGHLAGALCGILYWYFLQKILHHKK